MVHYIVIWGNVIKLWLFRNYNVTSSSIWSNDLQSIMSQIRDKAKHWPLIESKHLPDTNYYLDMIQSLCIAVIFTIQFSNMSTNLNEIRLGVRLEVHVWGIFTNRKGLTIVSLFNAFKFLSQLKNNKFRSPFQCLKIPTDSLTHIPYLQIQCETKRQASN